MPNYAALQKWPKYTCAMPNYKIKAYIFISLFIFSSQDLSNQILFIVHYLVPFPSQTQIEKQVREVCFEMLS